MNDSDNSQNSGSQSSNSQPSGHASGGADEGRASGSTSPQDRQSGQALGNAGEKTGDKGQTQRGVHITGKNSGKSETAPFKIAPNPGSGQVLGTYESRKPQVTGSGQGSRRVEGGNPEIKDSDAELMGARGGQLPSQVKEKQQLMKTRGYGKDRMEELQRNAAAQGGISGVQQLTVEQLKAVRDNKSQHDRNAAAANKAQASIPPTPEQRRAGSKRAAAMLKSYPDGSKKVKTSRDDYLAEQAKADAAELKKTRNFLQKLGGHVSNAISIVKEKVRNLIVGGEAVSRGDNMSPSPTPGAGQGKNRQR